MARRTPFAAVLAAVIVTAGCGEKDEPDPEPGPAAAGEEASAVEGGGDDAEAEREPEATEGRPVVSAEAAIRRAVAGALGGDPNDACERYVTPRFVRDAYGGPGGCRGAQGAGAEFEVAVARVEVAGATATATARPSDGPYAGEELDVALVGDRNRWRVDALTSDIPPGP